MKAMILAAGKGTRVRPLTSVMPKPMIPLVRKPVLESIIEHLRLHGINQMVINTSYLSHAIEGYFRDGERFGVEIAYSYEGRLENGEFHDMPLGSAGGMRKVQDFSGFFDDTFVVLCGDALIDVDLTSVIRFHRERKALATIVLKDVPRAEVSKYGVVATAPDGKILRFQEKPSAKEAVSTTVNTGIYIFEPGIFDFIPEGREFDIGGQLFPALVAAGVPFYGMTIPFQWVDIGSIPDFWEANRLLLQGKVSGHRLPGREIVPGVRGGIHLQLDPRNVYLEGPVYIGSGTAIGNGARIIGPTIIGANCVIEAGAEISESFIGDYTRVSGAACLERKMVFAGKCVEPDGSNIDIADADLGWLIDDVRKEILCSSEQELLQELSKGAAREMSIVD
jgi:mannose-1-phosphate guanylyltransferase